MGKVKMESYSEHQRKVRLDLTTNELTKNMFNYQHVLKRKDKPVQERMLTVANRFFKLPYSIYRSTNNRAFTDPNKAGKASFEGWY